MSKKKRFRGIHYHREPNGTINIWITGAKGELLVMLRIQGNRVHLEKGIMA